jgi:cell division protein FtsW (lipid II flippase)
MLKLVRFLGPLRLALLVLALALIVLRPDPGTRAVYSGWAVVPTLIAPILVPNIFMVLLLDAIMSVVFLSSYPQQRQRYRRLIAISAIAAGVVFAWWWPYFAHLVR